MRFQVTVAVLTVGVMAFATACQSSKAKGSASTGSTASTVAASTASSQSASSKETTGSMVTTASGLEYEDLKIGTGPSPKTGQSVTVNYTGWLFNGGKQGAMFDSSLNPGRTPFTFVIGEGQVIKGWDEGVATMKVGGRRILIIPPDLGYGATGTGPIPPNSTLKFDVELLAVK